MLGEPSFTRDRKFLEFCSRVQVFGFRLESLPAGRKDAIIRRSQKDPRMDYRVSETPRIQGSRDKVGVKGVFIQSTYPKIKV